MRITKDKPDDSRDLREQAEKRAKQQIVEFRKPQGQDTAELVHELRVHQIELEIQNEELRNTQLELAESRNKYCELYDFAPVGYFTLNKEGLIVGVNLTGAAFLGEERGNLLRSKLSHFIAPDSQDEFYLHHKQVIESGARQSCEVKLRRKDGTEFPAQLVSVAVAEQKGEYDQFRMTMTDITERKLAEKEMQNLAKFPSENPYPIVRIHKDGTVLYANKASEPLLKAKDSAVGLPAPPECCQLTKETLTSGHIGELETERNKRIFSFRAVPIAECNYVNFYGRDITEQKKAEDELRQSEDRFKTLADETSDSIVIHDGERILEVNKAFGKIWGCEPQKAVGAKMAEFVTPASLEVIKDRIRSGYDKPYEVIAVRKDGTQFNVEIAGKPITYKGRTVRIATARDITERKRAEQALRESESLLRGLFENMTSGAAIYKVINDGSKGSDYIIRDFNAASLRIDGKRKDEVIGKSLIDLRPNIDQYGLISIFQKVWRTGEPGYFPSTIYVDEKYSNWYENRVFKLPTGEIVAIYDDVTERKRAEELLQGSEERLKAALDAAELGTWDWDLANGQITWTGHHEQLLGFKEGEFDGQFEAFEKRVHRDDIAGLKAAVEKAKKEQTEYSYEYRVIWPDGTVRWIAGKGRCHYDQTGRAVRMLGTVHDITERKQAEETLRMVNIYNRTLIEVSIDPLVTIGPDGKITDVNKATELVTGLSRERLVGSDFSDYFTEPQKAREGYEKVIAEGLVRDYPLTIRHTSGSTVDVLYNAITYRNEAGEIQGVFAAARDITKRKLADERLLDERNLLRTVIDHLPDKIYVKNLLSQFVICNKSTINSEGLKNESELVGKTDFDLYEQATAQQIFEKEQQIIRTGLPIINLECQRADKKGNLICALQTKVPLKDSHNNIVGIVGINRDITEHKEYQIHLKQLAAKLTLAEELERRHIAGEIHDEVGQTLAMVKIKLDTLRNSTLLEASAAEIAEISSSVEKVIQETRTLTFELSNPLLYELGLEVAVAEWLNERVQVKHGIATEFQDDGKSKPLDNDMRILLFRNTRELLMNCIKHANAGKVRVNIRRINSSIEVVVEDNGVGFDLAEVRAMAGKKSKFGLFSIRENIENLGGHFIIESKPGAGCKAIMTAPLKDQNDKKEA